MPQKPKIETELSESDLSEFRRLLATGRLSIDGLCTWLEGRGYEIGRSSVGRYAKNFDEVAAKLRESREVTDALVAELGDAAAQGKQGRLLVEMTRSLVFDLLMALQSGEEALDPKSVMMLGKGLAELGKALRLDQDFETKIAEQAAARAKEEAATKADAATKQLGLNAEQAAFIRAEILGVPVDGSG